MRKSIKRFCILSSLIFSFAIPTRAQGPYFLVDTFAPNTFPYITELVPCTDGSSQMFVLTQRGKIWIVNTANPTLTPKLFLDISDLVSQVEPETGLLGLAFHPNHSANKLFYLSYTRTIGGQLTSYISRFNVSPLNPDSALRSSEVNLITLDQPYENHDGGKIGFGPDNYLYISFGDGGSGGDPGNRAQNGAVIFGKILRIDVNSTSGGNQYGIPASNPYFGNTSGFREEIYSYGLRNVWKFSWDSQNGKMWCGDVGQDLYEEIDTLTNGGNYGWNVMEGFHCYNPSSGCDMSGKILPLFEYSHNGTGFSITGGYVYRGTQMPSLFGKYIFGDFSLGKIWAFGSGISDTLKILNMGGPCSSFGVDNQKNIYACLYSSVGKVLKIYDTSSGIEQSNELPSLFELKQNYPNPFNPTTKIEFNLRARSTISMRIYNSLGSLISVLSENESFTEGSHFFNFNSPNLPSGIYYYKLTADGLSETKRMVIVK
ncbi:hypothetical protein BH10BAC5_BH10BAC5_10390 [soil metagenome]